MNNKYEIKKVFSNRNKCLVFFIDTVNKQPHKLEFRRTNIDTFEGYIPNNINKSLLYYTLFNFDNRLIRIIPEEYQTLEMAISCACNKFLKIPNKYKNIEELHNLRYIKTLDDDNYNKDEIKSIPNIYQYISYIEEKYKMIIDNDMKKISDEEEKVINQKIIKLDKSIKNEINTIEKLKKEKEYLTSYLNEYNNSRKYIKLNK